MIDTFLFDLDGTLIDSIGLIRRSYAHTLRVHRQVDLAQDEWLAGLGRPLRWQFQRFSDDPAEIECMIATYRAFNLEHHDALVGRFPGALEAVQGLKGRGGKLGVVTSKLNASARRGLALCGFDDLFEVVIGMDDVTIHKPEPEPVLAALRALGARAESAVMVGDSPHDLNSGRAAGTLAVAVAWGPFPRSWLDEVRPDAWLESPPEIGGLDRLSRT